MKNSKLIALLSAGALVLTSFSGLAVSGNSALAASQPRQRYSDGMFQSVVIRNGGTFAANHNQTTSVGRNRINGNSNAAAGDASVKDFTGFVTADWFTGMKEEKNDTYTDGNGFAEVAMKDGTATLAQAQTAGYFNYDQDRTNMILNKQINAIWQKGYVGDNNVVAWLTDEFDKEDAPTQADAAGSYEYIELQTVTDTMATPEKSAPSFNTKFAALTTDKDFAPNTLKQVREGNFTGWNGHGVALWGIQAAAGAPNPAQTTNQITLALDAKVGHYTMWDGYIYVGDNGSDDDGEYLPVHIAYPWAVYNKNIYAAADGATNAAYLVTGVDARTVLYGGEETVYAVDEVILKDLPHDQWIWEITDDTTNSFEIVTGKNANNTEVGVKATATATKGATAKLTLYNSYKSDDCKVYTYDLLLSSPNFYTEIYLRNDKDIDGNGVNYANGTFTTAQPKAEIRATATMLVNEGITDIAQNQLWWTWTYKDGAKADAVKATVAGPNNDLCTFEVVGGTMPETPVTTTYIVRAYSINVNTNGTGVFDQNGAVAAERMYGERTITVVFDKNYVETITTDALPVGSGFTVDDANYVVTSDTEVEFAKYVGTATSYTVPAQVTFGNFTYNVTSVGKKAFASKTQLKEVTVPESVTVLGNGAFKNCKKLTSVTFLGNITNTPKNVFLKAGAKNGKKLKVSVGAGTSEETIKGLKKSNKNAKIK